MEPTELFGKYLQDNEAWDMFLSGPAGSGKTTLSAKFIDVALELGLTIVVCAHTHKACDVLRSVLPDHIEVITLHKFLNKVPTVNSEATNRKKIDGNVRVGETERPNLLIVDEYSMVGEADLMDVRGMQDPEYEGEPGMKVLWMGDEWQLPPVKDQQTVIPYGDYQISLTKIHRNNGPLTETIEAFIRMLKTGKPEALPSHSMFHRGVEDLAGAYKNYSEGNAALLCYTNKSVQHYNQLIEGTDSPMPGANMFSPTLHRYFTFNQLVDPAKVTYCDRYGDSPLTLGSKYKTLEFIIQSKMCDFFEVSDDEDKEVFIYPVIFGTYNYKLAVDKAGTEATSLNAKIMREQGVGKAQVTAWCKQNYTHPLARQRAKAWRIYLTLKETVMCMDFPHAMTIHKSQGSTFNGVFIDVQDLDIARKKNYEMYMRLFYVAVSRASKLVVTN